MASQFRDTTFGLSVRFLFGKRVFRFPDESDPSLWRRKFAQRGQEKPHKSTEEDNGNNDVDLHHANESLENGKDIYLVTWYGPDDPENPKNWPSGWKSLITFQVCFLLFAVYMTSSIYTPGEGSLMEDFDVSQIVATLGLSFFSVGYGLGPMIWSPMSEMPRFGRNPLYFWTLLAFVLVQLPTGFATNMPMFIVFRFLTGFVGSPALATGGGTISDIYDPVGAAYGTCLWAASGVFGPEFGPILGGFGAAAEGWRWTIWIITWLCGFVLIMLFFFLPETSEANILYKRAKRLRKATGDDRFRSQGEVDAAHYKTWDHLVVLGRAFKLTFSEPIVFFMDLYGALLYGVLFTWFESFPLVFGDIYGFDLRQQGLVFLGIFVGIIITLPLFLLWMKYYLMPKFGQPDFKPEVVLPPTFFGAVALPICLFWYGWTARATIHWIVPIIGSSFFAVSMITLFPPVTNYLGISYTTYAASIFAGFGLFRASFGAIFPLFARQLFHKLGIGPGNSLLGAISVCFIPIPIILFEYGERIRGMSKNARHDA